MSSVDLFEEISGLSGRSTSGSASREQFRCIKTRIRDRAHGRPLKRDSVGRPRELAD